MFFPLRNGLIKSKDYKAKEMWGNQKIKMNCCAFVDQNWNPKTRINKIFFWNIGSFSFAWLCLHLPSNIKYTRFALFLLENCTLLIWGSTWSSIRETCIKAKKTMKYNLRKNKTGSFVLWVIMTPNEKATSWWDPKAPKK